MCQNSLFILYLLSIQSVCLLTHNHITEESGRLTHVSRTAGIWHLKAASTHLRDNRSDKGNSLNNSGRELLTDAEICSSHGNNDDRRASTINRGCKRRQFFRSR